MAIPAKKPAAKAPTKAVQSTPSSGENAVESGAPGREMAPAPKPMSGKELMLMAQHYMVPFSAQAMRQLVGKEKLVPAEKVAGFEAYLKKTATGLYPALAQQIAAGIEPAYLMDPYRQAGKQVLGPNFEPNFQTDSNVRAVFAGATDPASQRPAMMTLEQWTQYLKTNPVFGWKDTPQGKSAIQSVLQGAAQAFNGQGVQPPQGSAA